MIHKQRFYLLTMGAFIAFGLVLSSTFAQEKAPQKSEQTAPAAQTDEIVSLIQNQVMDPLLSNGRLLLSISRSLPTTKTSYQLVESTFVPSGPMRTFNVLKHIDYLSPDKEPEVSVFLKLSVAKGSSEILVESKGKWIKVNEHPVLNNLLPSHERADPVTP